MKKNNNFWLFIKVILYAIMIKIFKRTVTQIYFSNYETYYELKIVSIHGWNSIKIFEKKEICK